MLMKCNLGLGQSCDEGSKGDVREFRESSNAGDRSGVKRSYDVSLVELGLNLVSVGGGSEGEGRGKKIRGFEQSDDVAEDQVGGSIGIRAFGGDITCFNGNVIVEEVGVNGNSGNEVLGEEFDTLKNWDLGLEIEDGHVKGNLGKSEKLGSNSSGGGGGGYCDWMNDLVSKLELDLNESFWDAGYGGCGLDFLDFTRIGSRVAEKTPGVAVISSDDEDDKKNVGRRDDRGKGKAILENVSSQETTQGHLDLGLTERHWAADVSSSMDAERRYTREEKGKAKVVESFISPANDPNLLELFPQEPELTQPVVSQVSEVIRINEACSRFYRYKFEEENRRYKEERRAENAIQFRQTAKEHALRFARVNPQPQDHLQEPLKKNHELEIPSTNSDLNLEDFPGPFSSALKGLRERNAKCSAQKLIQWKPLEHQISKILIPIVPSLVDVSLRALVKNSEAIVSLDHVPDWLRQRFTTMLCDARKMNSHVLNLLLRDSPTEIRVKDCSWITDAQAVMMFGKLDAKNLRVLQLDLLGQCMIEDILLKSIIQSSNSLMFLRIISLRGACRLTDDLLNSLVTSAPLLQSVNVGQSSLLTYKGIEFLADSLGPTLRELYIDDCQKIEAIHIMKLLTKFQLLEVLSIAGIDSVCDGFVSHLVSSCGGNMKELDMANCGKITDVSLEEIGRFCPKLQSLNISNLNRLTDLGLLYLANGCRSVQTLKCCRNGFSDTAFAAFLEASGQSLKELSLNGINKVGTNTALSLAKYSRNLSSLDLSWCRRITNEALGLIVDSCLSLKLLKLFGCSQITEIFLSGHSNPQVQIVGLNLKPLLEHVNMLESEGLLLHYSPI